MHLRPEQLRANLEALDSETIRAKLRAGQMTEAARDVANAVLAARGQPEEQTASAGPLLQQVTRGLPVAAPLPGRSFVLLAFRLYLAFATLCAVVIVADPPWARPRNGSWEGMMGGLAALAAGMPWTHVHLRSFVATNSAGALMIVAFLGVAINSVLFAMYLRRA